MTRLVIPVWLIPDISFLYHVPVIALLGMLFGSPEFYYLQYLMEIDISLVPANKLINIHFPVHKHLVTILRFNYLSWKGCTKHHVAEECCCQLNFFQCPLSEPQLIFGSHDQPLNTVPQSLIIDIGISLPGCQTHWGKYPLASVSAPLLAAHRKCEVAPWRTGRAALLLLPVVWGSRCDRAGIQTHARSGWYSSDTWK